jgi:hypothetical protein
MKRYFLMAHPSKTAYKNHRTTKQRTITFETKNDGTATPLTSLDSRMHALIVAWRHVFALGGWVCVVRELFANLVFCSIPSVNQHFSGGMQIYSTSFLSVYLPTYLQSNLSIYRSVDFSVCLSVSSVSSVSSVHPSVRPSIRPPSVHPNG